MDNLQKNLQEVNEFLEISYELFDKKLSAIEAAMDSAQTHEEKAQLKQKAIQLYAEYKQTLTTMENYINTL